MPLASIIISLRQENDIPHVRENLKNLEQISPLEIIYAVGANPSHQRNLAAQRAQGDFLIFFDDDSLPSSSYLQTLELLISRYPKASVFGGPSLFFAPKTLWQWGIQEVLKSFWMIGPMRAKFKAIGETRQSHDRELILCNLCVKKEVFLGYKGLNRMLYPSEENEFLQRIGHREFFIYSPELTVQRPCRENIYQFFKQIHFYGMGRFHHSWTKKKLPPILYCFPLIFLLGTLIGLYHFQFALPLIHFAYSAFSYTQVKNKRSFLVFAICGLITHLAYPLGLLCGPLFSLSKYLKKNAVPVVIKTQHLKALSS